MVSKISRRLAFALVPCLILYICSFFSVSKQWRRSLSNLLDNKATLEEKLELAPLQHSFYPFNFSFNRKMTQVQFDAFNPIHNYVVKLCNSVDEPVSFRKLPMLHTWIHYLEAYHNHFSRFRGKEVVFMEIGVQSGGKIPLLRDYIGPGLTYVGIDINPACIKFESADWVHIEIGDSQDIKFLKYIKEKYPKVDIFLDDGGHTMPQQMLAMQEMIPHVQPNGIYVCEDLSTSWGKNYGGVSHSDVRDTKFLDRTMVGLVHKSIDWLMAGWRRGIYAKSEDIEAMPISTFQEVWWKVIPQQVKHIHYYNQIVIYEKGNVFEPTKIFTNGLSISQRKPKPINWDKIINRIQRIINSPSELNYNEVEKCLFPLEKLSKSANISFLVKEEIYNSDTPILAHSSISRKEITTDTVTPIHHYFLKLSNAETPPRKSPLHYSWLHSFEAYHNHFSRFRGKNIVFMEVGVQHGGKIPLLRDYIGPGLTYVGIDNTSSSKVLENLNWIHIEIGSLSNTTFIHYIKEKYKKVDIFLDNGGQNMKQQMLALQHFLPHIQSDGIYVAENLATSWSTDFEGRPNEDARNAAFLDHTMFGLIHKTMDWFNAEWRRGAVMTSEDIASMDVSSFDVSWWKNIPRFVKHMHFYNQIVVYEKGITFAAKNIQTVGSVLPYYFTKNQKRYNKVNWDEILTQLQGITKSRFDSNVTSY